MARTPRPNVVTSEVSHSKKLIIIGKSDLNLIGITLKGNAMCIYWVTSETVIIPRSVYNKLLCGNMVEGAFIDSSIGHKCFCTLTFV